MKTPAPASVSCIAQISEDGHYRYTLERVWVPQPDKFLLVVMLNPSRADSERSDPTITRLTNRAFALGYDGLLVGNLFAWRSPYPEDMYRARSSGRDIVGPENDDALAFLAARAYQVVVAWGGGVVDRDAAVLRILYGVHPHLYCWGHTIDGYPKHPLHLAYREPIRLYTGRFRR